MIEVFLVDDQRLVRSGFRMLIEAQADMSVVGEAGNGQEAIEALAVRGADVVLMDVRMPVMDGVEATRRLRADPTSTAKILALTTFDLDEYAFPALQAGASGFILKDTTPEDLLTAIRTVVAGDSVVAPSTTRRLLEHLREGAMTPAAAMGAGLDLAGLTDRELEVWRSISAGKSNLEIGESLYMAEATVKTHVSRLLAKLNLRDRVQLVVLAYECGLVSPTRDS